MMNLFAGSRLIILAAIVLVVISTSFSVIQYIQGREKDRILLEIQNTQVDKRKQIDEAIISAPRTATDSLLYLESRRETGN